MTPWRSFIRIVLTPHTRFWESHYARKADQSKRVIQHLVALTLVDKFAYRVQETFASTTRNFGNVTNPSAFMQGPLLDFINRTRSFFCIKPLVTSKKISLEDIENLQWSIE